MELFKEYIAVGGMPRVVQTFVDTNNFNSVFKLQRDIVGNYGVKRGIKLSTKNVSGSENVDMLPLYMAMFL